MPMVLGGSRLGLETLSRHGSSSQTPSPAAWVDSAYDSRFAITAANTTGLELHDHLLAVPIPSSVTVDANSLRVYETFSASDARVDQAYDWRYGVSVSSPPNRFQTLPAYKSGSTLYVKVLGYWPAAQSRYLAAYWNAAGGIAAPEFSHLDVTAAPSTVTIVRGATGDKYDLTVCGTTVSYTQLAGDTTATLVATGLAAAVNAIAGTVATATSSGAVVTITPVGAGMTSGRIVTAGTTTTAANCLTTSSGWTVTVTAGTTNDVYALTMGGATYSHTMTAGQTATQIAAALVVLINAGAVATATNSAGVLTITPVNARLMTFQVVTAGTTTVPANLVVSLTAQPRFKIGRSGPETVTFSPATYGTGLPLGLGSSVLATRVGFGRADTNAMVMGDWRVNGDATSYGGIYGPNQAGQYTQPLTVTRNGPTGDYTGRVVYSIRAAGDDWLTTYTVQHQHRFYTGRKSDDTGAQTLNKFVDVFRIVLTQTCQRAYTPQTVASSVTAASSVLKVFGIDTTGAVFTGNVTEAAGNQKAGFYFRPGTDSAPQEFLAAADLSALPVVGTIFGMHGNTLGTGMLINSVTTSGMGSQTPEAKIASGSSRPSAQLQFRNLSNATTIPLNAQIVTDLWFVQAFTNNATTVGDNLLPDELVTLMRGLGATPSVTVGRRSTYASTSLALSMALASTDAVTGLTYFRDNATAKTTVARAYTWSEHTKTGVLTNPDDDDGSYGVAHALAGLVLRYLRTRDANLVQLIEDYVQYFITIEAGAVAAYGSFWNGAMPYWYWPSSTSSGSSYTTEGGIQEAVGSTGVDPLFGSALGSITYTQGQIRRKTSIDQMHIATFGLYHYLYLLRNESAFTANTTLRTNALALLSRMSTFEATWYAAANRVIGNAYAICNGGTLGVSGSNNNGISSTLRNTSAGTSLANPFWGDNFGTWNVSDTDGAQANASANISLDDWFRSMYAPDSVEAGVRRYIQGMAMDMLLMDLGRHDVLFGAAVTTSGTIGKYPAGWNMRPAVASNTTEFESTRTSVSNNGFSSDKHLLQVNNSSARDHMSGRAAQRACVLAFAALMDPSFSVPTEQNGVTTTRSINVKTALDDQMRTLAIYGTEPTTKAQRLAVTGPLGRATTYDPQIVEAPYTGYWMLAVELWHLAALRVQGTNLLPTYYRWAGV